MKKYIIFSLLLLGLYTFSACYPITTLPQTDENQSVSSFNTENFAESSDNKDKNTGNSEEVISDNDAETEIPMAIRIDGVLYTTDGEISDLLRCGIMDGRIDSCVDGNSFPEKDNQSNFGSDFGFQYGPDETVHVLIDGNWIIFRSAEGTSENRGNTEDNKNNETVMFDGKVYQKNALSASTLEWLENYNGLSHSEQMLIEYIPEDLIF